MSYRFWFAIEQDAEGNLVVLDDYDDVIAKIPRTKPADLGAPAAKWAEVLVGDIARAARFAAALMVKPDNGIARF